MSARLIRLLILAPSYQSLNPLTPTVAMGIKHHVPDWVKPSCVIFLHRGTLALSPDVKNYKWRLNPVWHRIAVPIWQQWASAVNGLSSLFKCAYTSVVYFTALGLHVGLLSCVTTRFQIHLQVIRPPIRRHPIAKSQLLLLVTVSMAGLLRVNKVLQQFRSETILRFRLVQFRDLSALEVF